MASQLEQVEAMRRQLIGDITHELRTPLTSIKGYMEGLVDGVVPANAETFNPTEAGSRRDHIGPTSTSRLRELSAQGDHLRTSTQMAFWLAPGERSEGQRARNTNTLSDYLLSKDVRIGYERWPQALDYRVTFTVPTNAVHRAAQFETVTGYMPPEFDTFWQFDP